MRNLEIRKLEIRNSRRRRAGFTLIELMMVIGIITIVSSVVIGAINPAQKLKQANDAVRATNISSIKTAVDSYTTLRNGVPPNCDGMAGCDSNGTDYFKITGSDPVGSVILANDHLKSIPNPPESNIEKCGYYAQLYPSSAKKYRLRWCYTSWTQTQVNNLDSRYNCEWDVVNKVALCYTGTESEIPAP